MEISMDFVNKSCDEFVEVLASKAPVPGGGGASALVGAVGVALGRMVGSLTVDKKKYEGVRSELIALNDKADKLRRDLLTLVNKDAEVFETLLRVYGMPKDTPEQRTEKALAMEKSLRECCDVPLTVMEKCCEAIKLHGEFAIKGASIAASDAGCGAICCKAALRAAALNVFVNTKSMTDREYAEEINTKAKTMLAEYTEAADKIYNDIADRFVSRK
jgi:formiminotetrahydrofolate cyclodeaminase